MCFLALGSAFAADPEPAAPPTASAATEPTPNFHLTGWLNTVVPGGGQFLLGNYLQSGIEFTAEVGLTAWGYSLSRLSPLTLDGVPEDLPQFSGPRRRGTGMVNIDTAIYADLLQEAGIKGHLVNVFNAYREAAHRSGHDEGIDQRSTLELFLDPFHKETLANPWVYGALGAVAAGTVLDYFSQRSSGLPPVSRLTPTSNFLYSVNYQIWQPIGSGAPEEMFYRGFLQHELYDLIPSPFFAIPITTAAFAFSHAPGPGRLTAAVAGAYLGWLAHKYNGNLGPGITLHFWSVVILGIETVLLSQNAQHTTPPASLAVQINY